jgi:hypothetical protein
MKVTIPGTHDGNFIHTLAFLFFLIRIRAYPAKAPKTKRMQERSHAEIAVRPSTFGDCVMTLEKMLIKTRKSVTSNVNRPDTSFGGIKKLT